MAMTLYVSLSKNDICGYVCLLIVAGRSLQRNMW